MKEQNQPLQAGIVPDETLAMARKHLSRRDTVLKEIIRRVGPCTLRNDPDHFSVLVRSIISQQISTRAAQAIHARLCTALKQRITPRKILGTTEETLRTAGLSSTKTRSLLDLAEKCSCGAVPLKRLASMEDEEIIDHLLPVRGIGRWTAEMFLIFSLGRLDVLPVGDYGLRAGASKQYALADLPGREELQRLAEPWQPYRSIGTWYIWRSLGFVPQSETEKE
jgi:DNA-3-methyladenine glycosylase II